MPSLYMGYQKTLVDAFFFEQDQQLLKAFHESKRKSARRSSRPLRQPVFSRRMPATLCSNTG